MTGLYKGTMKHEWEKEERRRDIPENFIWMEIMLFQNIVYHDLLVFSLFDVEYFTTGFLVIIVLL